MNSVTLDAWNGLVNSCADSKIYHLYQWGALLEEVHGHKLIYLLDDGGVFPAVYIKSRIFGNRLVSLPFADYGGPCAKDKGTAQRLISKCRQVAQELDVDFIEIRCPDSLYFDAFKEQGFVRRDEYLTFMLPLDRKIEELWAGVGDKNRNMVRKAEKNGVQVVEAKTKADLRIFYLLYRETMKRLGSPPQPFRFFGRMWDLFYPKNLIMPLVKYEERYIAGSLFFLHNDIIHHAYSCSSRESLNLAPNNLIQWHIIRWGNEYRFRHLDFGRSRENAGNVLFKRRWGGGLLKMPYFYKFYKKKELPERQEKQYQWVSHLWSKYVPGFAANRIGPWIIKQIG